MLLQFILKKNTSIENVAIVIFWLMSVENILLHIKNYALELVFYRITPFATCNS